MGWLSQNWESIMVVLNAIGFMIQQRQINKGN